MSSKERETSTLPVWLMVVGGVVVAAYLIFRFALAYWAANT